MKIIPAILPKNYEDMKNKISFVRDVADTVQIDFCDGIFVPSRTWPFSTGGNEDYNFQRIMNEDEGMPFWEDINFEFDLMVSDVVENFDTYMKLGPKAIIFHIEAIKDLNNFKEFIEGIDSFVRDNTKIGIAINLDTESKNIFPLVNFVDFVQIMGIANIGFQGEDFDNRTIDKVREFKKEFPDLEISVDGGVNLENAGELKEAGVTSLVVGSSLFNSIDIIETIREFENI